MDRETKGKKFLEAMALQGEVQFLKDKDTQIERDILTNDRERTRLEALRDENETLIAKNKEELKQLKVVTTTISKLEEERREARADQAIKQTELEKIAEDLKKYGVAIELGEKTPPQSIHL